MAPSKRQLEPGRRVPSFVAAEDRSESKPASVFGPLVRLENWIEAHPLARLLGRILAVLTILATLATLYSANVQMVAMTEERKAREQERLARLRAELYRPAPGESGKGAILTELIRMNAIESVIDLSCERIGQWASDRCAQPPRITGLDVTSDSQWSGVTDGMTLEVNGADFIDINLEGLGSFLAPFILLAEDARFLGGSIRHSFFTGDLRSADLFDIDLSGTHLIATVNPSTVIEGNLSGARIDMSFSLTWDTTDLGGPVISEADPAVPFCDNGRRFATRIPVPGRGMAAACIDHRKVPRLGGWYWADRPMALGPEIQAFIDDFRRPVICDPRDLGAASNAPMPFDDGRSDDDAMAISCTQMTLLEAKAAFPDRWEPDARWMCADSDDKAFLARRRTVPPQPCVP